MCGAHLALTSECPSGSCTVRMSVHDCSHFVARLNFRSSNLSTYAQAISSEIDNALRLVSQYIIEGYDASDIKLLISKIASATELFLKRDVFPAKSNKDNFHSFIEELKNHSISQVNVDFIHYIRLLYNNCKHDPNSVVSILQVKELLDLEYAYDTIRIMFAIII